MYEDVEGESDDDVEIVGEATYGTLTKGVAEFDGAGDVVASPWPNVECNADLSSAVKITIKQTLLYSDCDVYAIWKV